MVPLRRRIVVGISGSSSPIYGIRTLEALRAAGDVEIHLVLTEAAQRTIVLETDRTVDEVQGLAHVVHSNRDLAAPISSGSFRTEAMIVAPCSMHSLSEVAHGASTHLLTRAADVHLKERRPLILMVRETPLHLAHLRNMVLAAETGATILPPIPAFYHGPKTIDDIINHSVGKALDLIAVSHQLFRPWEGAGGS
jgi:polyprenyl P-hydroxybenzoate/phenylacrylic acid decarboxylase-like protein